MCYRCQVRTDFRCPSRFRFKKRVRGAPQEGPAPSKNAPIQAPILAKTCPFMPIQTNVAHSGFFPLLGGYYFGTDFAHSASPKQFFIILEGKIEGGGEAEGAAERPRPWGLLLEF